MQRNLKIQIIILIIVILSILTVTIDFVMELSAPQRNAVYTIDFIICVMLALEFTYRLKTSENPVNFLKKNWYEILALIPAYAFSLLELQAFTIPARSLRFIRAFRLIKLLRAGILYVRVFRFLKVIWAFVVESKILYLLTLTFSIILTSSIAVYGFEHSVPTSPVKSMFDALWWAITTLTTVGYGDIVPVTFEGRVIGIILMTFGIGIWTAAISLLTVTLVEKKYKKSNSLNVELVELIKQYSGRLDELTPEERELLSNLVKLIHSA